MLAGIYHETAQVPFTIAKASQAAPTGLVVVNASKSGAQDGAIENVTTAMEYSIDEVNWISVPSGTKVSGLAAGNYYVRYAETGNDTVSDAFSSWNDSCSSRRQKEASLIRKSIIRFINNNI